VLCATAVFLQLSACGNDSMSDNDSNKLKTVGAHSVVFQRMHTGSASLETGPLQIHTANGLFVIGIGRGQFSAFQPPFERTSGTAAQALGKAHTYSKYPESGAALYTLAVPTNSQPPVIATNTPPQDEVTLAAVEVARTKIVDVKWSEAFPGKLFGRYTVRSESVTTTGPATLVAFWWGEAGIRYAQTAVPDGGFKVLGSVLEAGSLVQCAVAVKEVAAAGKYSVRWTATPRQAAQLWLIALQ
jgi:hypothetical protein